MLTHEKVVSFLKQNPALSLSVLEKEAQLPSSTLSKSLTGDRQLNSKHLAGLYPILVKYGFNEFTNPRAKIISVVNHKGGVGKTTTTLNLGKALSKLGYRVLLIDMDSQGNLSQSLGHDNPEKQVVQSLLKGEQLPICHIAENYDLAPSDLELAYADLELVQPAYCLTLAGAQYSSSDSSGSAFVNRILGTALATNTASATSPTLRNGMLP